MIIRQAEDFGGCVQVQLDDGCVSGLRELHSPRRIDKVKEKEDGESD
ncbi:MAG: hypothetical protein ACI35P_12050 [Bacillus sp. (in: firmicutes)]